MSKELYVFVCPDCNKKFRTDDPDQKVCSDCLKYRQPHKPRKQKKKILTFAEILHIAEIYYKIHGTYLHYGDIVALIDFNKKKCICCGAATGKNEPVCVECKKAANQEVVLKYA